MAFYDAVLHIDSKDPEVFRLVMRNAANYLNGTEGQERDLRIIANAGAVSLFTRRNAALENLAGDVAARGVRIGICANALAEQAIDQAEVWDFCQIVPAGLVEIVNLQRAGFAYIKP